MGIDKTGTDYKSYSYLEAGKDYKEFALADELNRVEQYLIPLSDDEEKRVERLVTDNLMVSLHDHITVFPDDIRESPKYTHEGRMTTAFEALAAGYWAAVFDNLMDGIINIESKTGWKWTEVLHDFGMRLCDVAHQDFLVHCTNVDQIQKAHDEGKVAWIAVVEGAAMIENEVDRYITWPGQALAYKVGQIEILRLRARAKKEMGERFDLREFHRRVLQNGAVPLDVLDAEIQRWQDESP